MIKNWPFYKNVLARPAKALLILIWLRVACSAVDSAIQKKIFVFKTAIIISNKVLEGTMNIVRFWKTLMHW